MAKSNLSRRGGDEIYMDYAASVSANPSSIHRFGVAAKKNLEISRSIVVGVLGARAQEVIFTSSGTESNNLAIQGAVWACREKYGDKILPHIITTNIEHPSVLATCELLAKRKLAQITIVPVETSGIVNPKKIKKEIKKNTVLVTVMYANNEIGTIQPIREIAKEIRHYNKIYSGKVLFHTDAVQAANYMDLNVERLGVDFLTLSGSKIEGAGKVGLLFKRKTAPFANIFGGGDQEFGLRPGTENLPEIIKFSSALKSAQDIKEKETKRLTILRDCFITSLKLKQTALIVNGDLQNRLPNNVNITVPKIPSDLLVIELSARGIMASSKSACKSNNDEGSYVIMALRPESNPEIGGVRFSLGRSTTKKDIDYAVKTLSKILQKLKKWYS